MKSTTSLSEISSPSETKSQSRRADIPKMTATVMECLNAFLDGKTLEQISLQRGIVPASVAGAFLHIILDQRGHNPFFSGHLVTALQNGQRFDVDRLKREIGLTNSIYIEIRDIVRAVGAQYSIVKVPDGLL